MEDEASSYAESEDIVIWPVLHKANTPVATSMKSAGDATTKGDAAEALDSLLLMSEAWYAKELVDVTRVSPFQ